MTFLFQKELEDSAEMVAEAGSMSGRAMYKKHGPAVFLVLTTSELSSFTEENLKDVRHGQEFIICLCSKTTFY